MHDEDCHKLAFRFHSPTYPEFFFIHLLHYYGWIFMFPFFQR
jgi:hypothetical protein